MPSEPIVALNDLVEAGLLYRLDPDDPYTDEIMELALEQARDVLERYYLLDIARKAG